MTRLITTPNLGNPDDIYEKLVQMHDGLSEDESQKLWARLALTLINHIGDRQIICEAIELARTSGHRSENRSKKPPTGSL